MRYESSRLKVFHNPFEKEFSSCSCCPQFLSQVSLQIQLSQEGKKGPSKQSEISDMGKTFYI